MCNLHFQHAVSSIFLIFYIAKDNNIVLSIYDKHSNLQFYYSSLKDQRHHKFLTIPDINCLHMKTDHKLLIMALMQFIDGSNSTLNLSLVPQIIMQLIMYTMPASFTCNCGSPG